jgi:putative Mg2+ transporter-C (MgtC) family protein
MSLNIYEIITRFTVAFLIGSFIGIDRERSHKSAGFKTNVIVCIVCALLTMISAYGFVGLGTGNTDPTRLISNILTGVGFIGGGVIYFTNKTGKDKDIKGITTAAMIWGTAALGIAIGLGYYLLAVITVAFIKLARYLELLLIKLKIIPPFNCDEE